MIIDRFTRSRMLFGGDFARLRALRVLVCGCGGVGGACADALFRSGVGHLTLIDADVFDVTNQNRQIGSEFVGQAKAEVLARLFCGEIGGAAGGNFAKNLPNLNLGEIGAGGENLANLANGACEKISQNLPNSNLAGVGGENLENLANLANSACEKISQNLPNSNLGEVGGGGANTKNGENCIGDNRGGENRGGDNRANNNSDNHGGENNSDNRGEIHPAQPAPAVRAIVTRLDAASIARLDLGGFDAVVDAIDDIGAKVELAAAFAHCGAGGQFVASMGAARRLDPLQIRAGSVWHTCNDPFARKYRYELKKRGFVGDFEVVYSLELPRVCEGLGSFKAVTAAFGLNIAALVVRRALGGV